MSETLAPKKSLPVMIMGSIVLIWSADSRHGREISKRKRAMYGFRSNIARKVGLALVQAEGKN
jgi:hypothetical protein